MNFSRLTGLGLLLSMSLLFAGCIRDDPTLPGFFKEDKAWRGDIPKVSPETFKKGIDSSELVVVSSDSLAAQKEAQNKQSREDRSFLIR
jgi:hypothetical protein